nr:ribonuclease H-like domain-containing protein [Tanacetum cinerariifolium]
GGRFELGSDVVSGEGYWVVVERQEKRGKWTKKELMANKGIISIGKQVDAIYISNNDNKDDAFFMMHFFVIGYEDDESEVDDDTYVMWVLPNVHASTSNVSKFKGKKYEGKKNSSEVKKPNSDFKRPKSGLERCKADGFYAMALCIQLIVEKLENASKSLNKLIDCQIVDNCKKRLGYENYNAVPPLYTRNFMPPKPDLSYTGLDEFAVMPAVENKSSEEKTKAVRKNNDASIIEELVSDDEEENVTQPKIFKKTVRPSIIKKEFVIPRQQEKTAKKTVKKVEHNRQNTHRPRENMSYLTDYKEIDDGYVAFGGNPKEGKIIGKGTKDETSGILKSFITRIKNLVDHKVEAVNTACYVQNRVFVVKPHNKTSCELFHDRIPTLSFMRPFGYLVTILNTKDHLEKFDGKADERFFVGYSLNCKAFKVFNSRTKIVEKMHIRFSESTPNVVGSGPDWLFDIDALTRTMNYEPVVAGTQFNGFADLKSSQDDGFKPSSDDGKKVKEDLRKENEFNDQEKEDNVNNTKNVNTVSSTVNAAGINRVNAIGELPFDPDMPVLEDVGTFDFSNEDEDDDAVADINNLDTTIQLKQEICQRIWRNISLLELFNKEQTIKTFKNACLLAFYHKKNPKRAIGTKWVIRNKKDERGIMIRNKARLVAHGHIQEKGIDYDEVFDPVARIEAIRLTEVKNASMPMETQKPLLKDENGEEVDVHMYRYLKDNPKLGLWYPKDSLFDLVAYTDSDYAGASLDRKSTTGVLLVILNTAELMQLVILNTARKPKRKVTRVPQLSGPTKSVVDEAVYKELDDRLVRAATTASSLEAEHDSCNIDKTQSKATHNESSSQGTDLGGGPRCREALGDTIAQTRFKNVLDLEKTKTTQALEIISLKRRVKKLEKKQRSRTHKLKRLYKGRKINDIDADEDITLVNDQDDAEMFDVNDLHGEEVFVEKEVADKEVGAAGEVNVTSNATTISVAATITTEEITLAQALMEIKTTKPKEKGIFLQEPKEQQELTDAEKATLFMQLLEKRRNFFAAKRGEDIRNKPPTQAQQRKIMCTYLKNVEGKKLKDLKNKSFDSIQEMFDRAFKRTMFEPHIEDDVWRKQQGYKVLEWKLYDSRGVHSMRMQSMHIYMLVEKKYLLTPSTLTDMLNKKLQIHYQSEMAYQLLKLILKQLKDK